MKDDSRNQRIDDKLDKVMEHITSIDVTLAKQHVSLEEHIKRTNMLEDKLEPIEKHVNMVNGAIKFIILLSALAAIYAVIK
jgi:archaellum component FlaC